jgi:single-strand DNA-binding protein
MTHKELAMSIALNTVLLAGHLTRDPQLKVLAQERSVAAFGLAINRRSKGQDGETKEEVTFVDCEAWGRTAELIGQYLTKGSPCFIEGRLKLDSWQDKEGAKHQRLKVVVEQVQFLGRPGGRGEGEVSVRPEPAALAGRGAGPAAVLAPMPSVAAVPVFVQEAEPPF